MKRILLFLLFFIVLFTGGCNALNPYKDIEAALDTKIEIGTILSDIDDHGGFPLSGKRFVKVSFSEETGKDIQKHLLFKEEWKPLPLTNSLKQAAEYCEYAMPYLSNAGYYYFVDRSNQRDNFEKMEESYHNFILAIYDSEENILYWFSCVV